MHQTVNDSVKGFALVSAMLIVLLLAGISAGTMYLVNTESRLAITDMEGAQAFYGAEAAMEKMMVDLNALYATIMAPTVTDIEGLAATSYQPVIANISYPEYDFDVPNVAGVPTVEVRTITSGPNEGLLAYITKLTLSVTALAPTASEVKMEREIEIALIPVFQFGLFSETDLSNYPGPGFNFAGRVHTNGNLFMASWSGLTYFSKLTAVGDVIRRELANTNDNVVVGRIGAVNIPTAPGGCDGVQPACRDLDEDEGSKVAGPTSADNPNWSNISLNVYNGYILNGDTGAKPMNLPFVSPGLRAVELVRRPLTGEDPSSLIGKSRLYGLAQIRVIISDAAAENPGGAGVRLANVAPYYTGGTYGTTDTAFAEGKVSWDSDFIEPPGWPAGTSWPLIDGYLLVQAKQAGGTFDDVTMEWLNLGIDRANPDAILKFQDLKDTNSPPDGVPNYAATAANMRDSSMHLHLGLYDTREGEVRDVDLGISSTSCAIGGIMNTVELDVGNLKRWLDGTTGSNGTNVDWVPQNGYVFYFSDRRGMLPNGAGDKLGEYGYEDFINPADVNGVADGVLEPSEDVNQNGVLDTYGGANLGDAFGVANNDPTIRIDCKDGGRKNRVSGARRALKLINGALGNVPTKPDATGGFTVATENPVYVVGNYNANDAGFGDPHAAAAVIADGASFLSKNWEDWHSWVNPTYKGSGTARVAETSWYRVAVSGGKSINFPRPAWNTGTGLGIDGGTHNFLRYLERWSGETFNYRGSLVSLYYSEYATGIFKGSVYQAPTRAYAFDEDFLELDKLPPGTPRFRDIVNLGYRQILTPD